MRSFIIVLENKVVASSLKQQPIGMVNDNHMADNDCAEQYHLMIIFIVFF